MRSDFHPNNSVDNRFLSCGHVLHKQFFSSIFPVMLFFSVRRDASRHTTITTTTAMTSIHWLRRKSLWLMSFRLINNWCVLFFVMCVCSSFFCWYQNSCLFFWIKIKVHSVRIKNVDVSWKNGWLFFLYKSQNKDDFSYFQGFGHDSCRSLWKHKLERQRDTHWLRER